MIKHKKDLHLKKIQELKEGWQRTQADFDNFIKRVENERAENLNLAKADFMCKITPVLDNFRRAFEHTPKSTSEVDFNRYILGTKQIEKQLEDILIQEGLQKIPAEKGTKFDHNLHEAISYEINELPPDQIIDELESGWMFGDRVLKPAKVRVSKGK